MVSFSSDSTKSPTIDHKISQGQIFHCISLPSKNVTPGSSQRGCVLEVVRGPTKAFIPPNLSRIPSIPARTNSRRHFPGGGSHSSACGMAFSSQIGVLSGAFSANSLQKFINFFKLLFNFVNSIFITSPFRQVPTPKCRFKTSSVFHYGIASIWFG